MAGSRWALRRKKKITAPSKRPTSCSISGSWARRSRLGESFSGPLDPALGCRPHHIFSVTMYVERESAVIIALEMKQLSRLPPVTRQPIPSKATGWAMPSHSARLQGAGAGAPADGWVAVATRTRRQQPSHPHKVMQQLGHPASARLRFFRHQSPSDSRYPLYRRAGRN